MQRKMVDFFNTSDTYSLPSRWVSEPLPTAPSKRPVGRPKKRLCTDASSTTTNRAETDENLLTASVATVPTTGSSESDIMLPVMGGDEHLTAKADTGSDPMPLSSTPPSLDLPATSQTKDLDSDNAAGTLPINAKVKLRGKYKAYSVKEKEAIVREAKERGIRITARDKSIAVSTLLGWMKGNFSEVQAKTNRGARCEGGGRKVATGNYDQIIFQWILEQRELHIPVSRQAIQDFARRLCTDISGFTASNGWLDKFMRRHQLSLRSRTSLSQKLPGDLEEKVTSFQKFIKDQRVDDEYEDEFIVNMDETPVFFDLVPNKTVDMQGNKSVIVRTSGGDKRHVTVMLAVSASGKVLPTFVIFKGKRPLKDIKAPSDVIVPVQEKAWVDESIMLKWVDDSLRAYTNRNRTLLVMDSFRCHLMESVKKRLRKANAELAVIPGMIFLFIEILPHIVLLRHMRQQLIVWICVVFMVFC